MKILSIEEEEDNIRVVTNNPNRPEFIYKKDKFNDFNSLLKEIKKSVKLEKKREDKRSFKVKKVKDDFEKELRADA